MKKYMLECRKCGLVPHVVWKISRTRGVKFICETCRAPKTRYCKKIPDEFQENGGEEKK